MPQSRTRRRPASGGAPGLLSPASLVPAFVLVVFVVVFVGVIVVLEPVAHDHLVIILVGRQVELEGRDTRHFEVGAALGAAQLIALVDVKLVDFDFGIAFGAGGHVLGAPRSATASVRSGNSVDDVPKSRSEARPR